MRAFPRHPISLLLLMCGLSIAPCVLAGTVPASSVVGAQSSDDIPLKSGPGSALDRAKSKTPATSALPSADWAKAAVQMAQDLMKAGKYPEALAKLTELDSVAAKTPNDVYLIERTRVAAASHLSDQTLLIHSLEAVMASGQAPVDERVEFAELLARTYFNRRDFSGAIAWSTRYFNEGGHDPAIRRALLLSHYLNNDFARAAQGVAADIREQEQAGKKPSEEQLRLLVSCAQKLDDKVAYASALEKYAAHYPKAK